MDKRMNIIGKYHKVAEKLLEKWKDTLEYPSILKWKDTLILSQNIDFTHLADLGASVMLTRDDILEGGSFVQCVVKNDLLGAVQRADSTASHGLKYLLYLREYVHFDEKGNLTSEI